MNTATYRANRQGWRGTKKDFVELEKTLKGYILKWEKRGIYYVVVEHWHTKQMGCGAMHNRVELIDRDTYKLIQLYNTWNLGYDWRREQKSRAK